MRPKRFLALWFPHFAAERRRPAGGAGGPAAGAAAMARPLVVTMAVRGRQMLCGVSPAAAILGLAPGQMLSDARALVPDLLARPAEPAEDRAALARLADWCGRYTPSVTLDPALDPAAHDSGEAGLWLDITGVAHLFGGEAALRSDLLARLRAMQLSARAAVADTPGAAWALARFSGEGEAVIAGNGQRRALARLPLAGLRLPANVVEGLERVGLRRIGALYAIPRAPLAARFGPLVADRLDQALGRLGEPLTPHRPPAPHRARLAFREPVIERAAIERASRTLLGRLAEGLERDGLGVRELLLSCYRVDGGTRQLRIATSRANRDADMLQRLLAEHFDKLDPGFGIEVMVLEAAATAPLPARQAPLPAAAPRTAAPDDRVESGGRTGAAPAPEGPEPPVEALLDRLINRLGRDAVRRLAPRQSHLPERAETTLPAAPLPGAGPAGAGIGWRAPAARPLRLLRRPEPVEAVALLPDHPPVRFRWRGRDHRVVRTDGPERIAPEWWHAGGGRLTRDYFRLEDAAGGRYWLFREGLAERGEAPAWYLHGLFA